jgi:Holliday junction resolvase RusA-like endonuclease
LPTVTFTVYRKGEPQGSKHAFVVPGKNGGKPRAVVVDNNKQSMRSYRADVRNEAMIEMKRLGIAQPMADKQVAVELSIEFTFIQPPSAKKRKWPSVAPDYDKLARSTTDALIGVIYADDAQVVSAHITKVYGPVENVHVSVRTMEAEGRLF